MNEKNYLFYILSAKEKIFYISIFEIFSVIAAHFFYDSIYPSLIFNIFIKKYLKYIAKHLQDRRNSRIRLEFSDFIMSVSASLNTGYSFENSIPEALEPIANLYGTSSIIYEEIYMMNKKLLLNIPIENIFDSLANRTNIEEIHSFCEIIKISKKSGGDMIAIIKSTALTIQKRIELKEEIETMVSSKKYEQLIMFLMPFVIFVYINFTQNGFFNPLYHNLTGIIISTICLTIYICSFFISKKILEIEV